MSGRLVVLASGGGSNLQAILDAIASGHLAATVVLVVANHANAFALERARRAGVPTLLAPYRRADRPRTAYDASLAAAIRPTGPDLIVLAGWMHIFTPAFLAAFPRQVINLHPALSGTFPGRDAIARAFAAHAAGALDGSGCMVHYVVPEVDAGPVVAQVPVPFLPGETLASFEARMHAAERALLLDAIADCLAGGAASDAAIRPG